ncbi:hypothetical protein IU501_13095 [Nocardia otitidiscaviarum]|uniref:hypothetical protein n=1 Tax=Nocardia otitidiscaviarum TaxID=1823 RepID=UPI0018962548|nr:hypothetical protein [Nocardia otitidiscaviarum]MBF6133934.1 hypothetical protein [Nocardia otitidiscaviarum]
MINRRLSRIGFFAATATMALAPVAAAPANADTPFNAPEVSFNGAGTGAVSATLRNPNDRGACWAEASIGDQRVFFGDSDPLDGYEEPARNDTLAKVGQTVTVTLSGLEPGSTIQVRGGCVNKWEEQFTDFVAITVPATGTPPATGSFGF